MEEQIADLIRQRARQLRIPLGRRQLTVLKRLNSDVHVNRHEAFIRLDFVFEHKDPTVAFDQLLAAVETFDRREHEERVKRVNEVKSSVLKWMAYLQRTLSPSQYAAFVESLRPDEDPDMNILLMLEGEYYLDRGIHYAP